jgi:hypothetical protein
MYYYNSQGTMERFFQTSDEVGSDSQVRSQVLTSAERAAAQAQAARNAAAAAAAAKQAAAEEAVAKQAAAEEAAAVVAAKAAADEAAVAAVKEAEDAKVDKMASGSAAGASQVIKPTVARNVKCVYVKDKSEAHRKCGACCQNENAIWNKKYKNKDNNTYCECNDMKMDTFNDSELKYASDYFNTTGTAINYLNNIKTGTECRDACLNNSKCSFSVFSKDNLCYNGTGNPKKASTVKTPGSVLNIKRVPPEVEMVVGANYFASDNVLNKNKGSLIFNDKLSFPNCAQFCLNTPGCTYGVGNDNTNCTLTSLPVQYAELINDINSVTFIP